jgi:UDP-glucose:(heptosyl)LPS alpha-1,3-glucosyltransferase
LESSIRKPRLAVVSPFLDKSHGTERMVVEWITRLSDAFEIHIYSQSVEDVDLARFTWHRIRRLRGPHIVSYVWWFAANRISRFWDRLRGLKYDLVFSPGINCFDADAVSVHIVFAEFVRRVRPDLKLSRNSIGFWPRLVHRKLYYRLAIFLEGIVFRNPRIQLILTARQTAEEINRFYGREGELPVISAALDGSAFNPERRSSLRDGARLALAIPRDCFAILLVGNDWRKKGLPALLDAIERLSDLPVDLFVVGEDEPGPYRVLIRDRKIQNHVHFLPPRKDVEFYYAAADAYAGPSLEDTFALPAAEAMACGLPVIVSARAGASALITDGADGLILDDPTDAEALATMIRRLCQDSELCIRLGANAATATRPYTWERSTRELAAIFKDVLRRKTAQAPEAKSMKARGVSRRS